MKIIARKREAPTHLNYIDIVIYALLIVTDIALITMSIALGWFTADNVLFDVVLALLLFAICGGSVAYMLYNSITKRLRNKLPDYLIVYDNDEFIFADGYRCKPTDIVDVTCNRAHNYTANPYLHKSYEHGSITVKTKDMCISYGGVETVEVAHTLIYECIKEYKLKQKNN
ncbi:MAG: hypothetical protein K2M47_06425 [Clostridiales bacterium]|nr:hypothetical protein [Clostridiales bacterium]